MNNCSSCLASKHHSNHYSLLFLLYLINISANKGAFKFYVSEFGGEGVGGLNQNASNADALEGGGAVES